MSFLAGVPNLFGVSPNKLGTPASLTWERSLQSQPRSDQDWRLPILQT
jgi:hypothetical protein